MRNDENMKWMFFMEHPVELSGHCCSLLFMFLADVLYSIMLLYYTKNHIIHCIGGNLLVPAHPGCPGQIPQSHKMVVCVCGGGNLLPSVL